MILVTRPQPQADEWAERLQAMGQQAYALPLIDIAPLADPGSVIEAWRELKDIRLMVFVSPNAVQRFANLRPIGAVWPANTLAAAPGPGTQQALQTHLQAAGLPLPNIVSPAPDSLQFDSEHLWPALRGHDWQGQRVLIVSGGQDGLAQGRPWLTQQLQNAGALVNSVLTYERQAAQWTDQQLAVAQAAFASPGSYTWLFSSSEAVQYLVTRMGQPPARAWALATHPRVAETAMRLGFSSPQVVSPLLPDISQAVAQLPRH
jgi:uroporphyrinogen-III synthase